MKNLSKIALCMLAALCLSDIALAQSWKNHTIQMFAHRGSRFEYPDNENTMYAFRESYKAGARGFETDVRMTKEGDLILGHDDSAYRVCGVDVRFEDLPTEECLKICTKAGEPMALCQELVDFLADKEGIYFEWEMKTDVRLYTQAMLDILCDKLYTMAMAKKHATSQYIFTSFDKRALTTMKRLHPDATLTLIKNQPVTPQVLMEAYEMGINRVSGRMEGTTRKSVRLAHRLGIHVSLWPVYDHHDFMLGAALGCDAMCCDRFSETAAWVAANLPFITVTGVAEPQH